MLHLYCPYCQEHREEEEFSYAGEAHIERPLDPASLSDKEWGEYLFHRKNPKGLHHEMWFHATGCRKFFNVTRDTVSYEIIEVYEMGQSPKQSASEVQE